MRKYSSFLKSILVVFLALYGTISYGQVSPDAGKKLFKDYCASCHDKKMEKKMIGPNLAGMEERWADYPQADLYAWIRNSQALIASGHTKANELSKEYNGLAMTSFPNLTDDEVGSLVAFVNGTADGTFGAPPPAPENVGGTVEASPSIFSSKWFYAGLLAVLAILSLVLFKIIGSLNEIALKQDDPSAVYESKTIWGLLTSKGVIGFALFALVIFGGYTTVNNSVNFGRQQGYQPEQPIKFSHATHAGLNKIDCQYCHDGARRSKHSVIPAANTCMNCHKAVTFGSTYGTAELTKIYASTGYNPVKGEYIPDYDAMPEDKVAKIYKEWIRRANKENDPKLEGASSDELKNLADDQWKHIVESLTNEQKKSFKGGIEWIRIHNLPDHVYYNHAQHVTVGKVECQTCHGKVEEMEVVQQMSPLSMGWCINCHRETEVQFEGEYYDSYEEYHKELKAGDRDRVTVEDIGGLECQKCHY